MERLQGPHNGLHHLGFAANIVCGQSCNGDGVFRSHAVFANDAEDDQPSANSAAKGNQPAAFGLKKLRKSRGFMAGLLVNESDARGHW